jgi:predicted nucleic acid-binding Zn ribbon protein
MAKGSKTQSTKAREDQYRARRLRTTRIFIIVFTVIIILSMVLSMASRF